MALGCAGEPERTPPRTARRPDARARPSGWAARLPWCSSSPLAPLAAYLGARARRCQGPGAPVGQRALGDHQVPRPPRPPARWRPARRTPPLPLTAAGAHEVGASWARSWRARRSPRPSARWRPARRARRGRAPPARRPPGPRDHRRPRAARRPGARARHRRRSLPTLVLELAAGADGAARRLPWCSSSPLPRP